MNERLYDVSARLAIYVEGVKVEQSRQFNNVLSQVSFLLTNLLSQVKYRTLDGLSKSDMNKLISKLRKSQLKIYSKYTQTLIEQLKEFTFADLEVNRRVYVSAHIEPKRNLNEDTLIASDSDAMDYILDIQDEDEDNYIIPLFGVASVTGNDERIWTSIINTPIPANGMFLVPFIQMFAASSQINIEHTLRKAWANKLSVAETLVELIGDGEAKQGISSQLSKIKNHATSVIHTAIAHPAAIVNAAVTSTLYSHYVWVSVMDDRTTQICQSRNRTVYQYGKGPLPPAHINCRSSIAPTLASGNSPQETLHSWLARQPTKVQADILGKARAQALRSGKITADDLTKLEVKPLTIDEFRSKIDEILEKD